MISFKGHHFKDVIILLSVRWYLAYPLSDRHIEELMAERGVDIDHSTINRWVIQYAPLLERAFTKRYQSQVGSGRRRIQRGSDYYASHNPAQMCQE